jgi:hypothetical protein
MSEIIVNAEPVDPKIDEREKTVRDVTETIHSAARIAETAIMSDDPKVKDVLKASARVLLDAALTKLDESVGASVADAAEDDDE